MCKIKNITQNIPIV